MKSKKMNLLATFAVALLLSVGASVGAWVNNAGAQESLGDPVLVGGEIEDAYILGEYLSVPSAQLTCGDQTMDAKVIVKKPNGELVQSANVHLAQGGVYTIEYRAVFDGKVKTVEKTFTVQTPMFSVSSQNSAAVYGEDSSRYQTGLKGVNVDLAEGDILTYNDIIDLNASEGEFLEFFLPPTEGAGTSDFRKITITLTDLHNPDIALTVVVQAPEADGSGLWYYDYTYVQAGGQNQTPTGFEAGTGKIHIGNDWGAPTRFSFYGMHGNNVVVGTETLKLTYNEAENTVYANGTKVIRLDDLNMFENTWNGFTTGEVRMKITGDKYSRPSACMFITKIGVNNLNQTILTDNRAPEITVDYDGYDKDSLPNASKGYSYPVFNATALDKEFGVLPVQTTVYYNYESSQRYQVAIKDGKFETARTGYYTIEYLSADGYGNVGKETVVVECKATDPALTVEPQGTYATQGKTGEVLLPAAIAYEGGTGKVETYATAKVAGGEEVLLDGDFRPEQATTYTITLYAVDMLGKVATYTYDMEIAVNTEPVFLEDVVLPKFFLSGYNYTLPTLSAFDYSSGKEEIVTSISVKDGGEDRVLQDGVGQFTADEEGYATVYYNAVGKMGSSQKVYKVPVVNTWVAEEIIDMTRYFYGENITKTADADSIKISSTQDVEYEFINPVIAHKFELQFAITQNEFSCVQLVFTDAYDKDVQFTVEIEKSLDQTANSMLKINGKETREAPAAGFYDGNIFNFYYDDVNKLLQEGALLKQEVKNTDGSVFAGFPSKLMYVTVRVIGVEGTAEIAWTKLGSQILSNLDMDTIKPSITLNGEYKSNYDYKTTCEIYSAISADVLSPETWNSLTVYDPVGNVVVDVNGLRLSGVPFDTSYFIELNYYGSYSVVYTSEDLMGREQTYYYAIFVADITAPIISLQSEMKTTAKVGESIRIAKAIAVDNVDGEVAVYIYVVDPDSIITAVKNDEKYKVTKAGVYEIRYMTIDAFGNLRIVTHQITVA